MTYSISAKIQDGVQNSEKSTFYRGYSSPQYQGGGAKFAQNGSISYSFKIKDIIVSTKIQDSSQNLKFLNFSEVQKE